MMKYLLQSLNRSVLPLFATMLGNDYVDARAFELFYLKKTPKAACRRYSASKKHQKIVSVLYWLEESAKPGGDLVTQVLSFIRPERKKKVHVFLFIFIVIFFLPQVFYWLEESAKPGGI